jgi:hypothetical protein
MPAIGIVGTEVQVTPADPLQIVFGGGGNYEFVDDRSPFSLRVDGMLEEAGEIIGVFGDVISGHPRYQGQIATLLLRLDNSNWRRDNHSMANFKVGRSVARPNGKHPFYHPEGTDVEGYPFIMRFASIDSRNEDEVEINSARENASRA